MVNLKKLKVKITGAIPTRFRDTVEDAIYQTFLRKMDEATIDSMSLNYGGIWSITYDSYYGFYIEAKNTKDTEYGSIVYWNNSGTKPKTIYAKKKFMVFERDEDYNYEKHKPIEGNQSFIKKIDGVDMVFTKIVNHPGIVAKRFIEEVLDDPVTNFEMFNIINDNLEKRKIKEKIQFKIFDKIMRFNNNSNKENREVVGLRES